MALVLLALAGSPSVHADDETTQTRQFREQYLRASRAYNAKDYAAAVPALQTAFTLQPVPQLLFNIGQAYRKLEQWSSARVYFEFYRVTAKGLAAPDRELLDQTIAEMRERERAKETPQVIEKTRLLYLQQEKPPPAWLRPLGITLGLSGLLALTGGVTFLALDGRCTSLPEPPALECNQIYGTHSPGIALTAVGGSALIVGATLFGLSFRKPSKAVVREARTLPENDTMPLLLPLERSDEEPPPFGYHPDGSRGER